jgi:hypothetical protein
MKEKYLGPYLREFNIGMQFVVSIVPWYRGGIERVKDIFGKESLLRRTEAT